MKKRFIVLVEFSKASADLLSMVYNLSLESGIDVLVVHQSLDSIPGVGESDMRARIKQENRKRALVKLKQFATDTLGEVAGIKYKVTTGHLAELVLKLQSPLILDFVFTGIKNKDLFERLLMGSTAIKLSDNTENIIIGVPEGMTILNHEILCVALVQQYPFNEVAFKNLRLISNKTRELRFFSVVKSEDDREATSAYLEKLAGKYGGLAKTLSEVRKGENVSDEIINYIYSTGGLLVIQKGSRNFTDMFRTFLVNTLVYDGQVPIVILPEIKD